MTRREMTYLRAIGIAGVIGLLLAGPTPPAIGQTVVSPLHVGQIKATIRLGQSCEALVIRRDLGDSGRFRGLSDLRGLRIALAARGISPHIDVWMFARKGNVNMEEVEIVVMPLVDDRFVLHAVEKLGRYK